MTRMLAWLVSDAFCVGLQMPLSCYVFIWPFLSLCSLEEERVGGRQGGREGKRKTRKGGRDRGREERKVDKKVGR